MTQWDWKLVGLDIRPFHIFYAFICISLHFTHPYALAYIIVYRLATGDIRPLHPYLLFEYRSEPFIYLISLWHWGIVITFDHLIGSNKCPPFSDSWIWPLIGLRHLTIYMTYSLYYDFLFIYEFQSNCTLFDIFLFYVLTLHFDLYSLSILIYYNNYSLRYG